MAFPPVYAPYWSEDGSGLPILPLVNVFHGLHAVLLSGWQRIAHTSACQRLSQRFARCFPPRMAAHCSFFRSSTSFTVCMPVLLLGWQRIALSSSRQRLSQFARRFTPRMVAHCSFFRSSMSFTVCPPFYSADGSGLLTPPLVNGFHDGLRTVFLLGWQRIALSSGRQRLSQFARRFPPRMAAHRSFFRSLTSFTVCAPFYSTDGSGLLILPLVDGFTTVCVQSYTADGSALPIFLLVNSFHDGLRAVFVRGSWRIACSSACQWLSRRFMRRIGQRIAADCSFFRSSTALTTVCAQSYPVDGSALPILPLVNRFHDGFRDVLLCRWRRIACSSACQWHSHWFTHHISSSGRYHFCK